MPYLQDGFDEYKKLDEGEWRVAIISILTSSFDAINKRLDDQNGKVKVIPDMRECLTKHKVYFVALGFVVMAILAPLAVAYIKSHLGI